jgi:hypothetical protein
MFKGVKWRTNQKPTKNQPKTLVFHDIFIAMFSFFEYILFYTVEDFKPHGG